MATVCRYESAVYTKIVTGSTITLDNGKEFSEHERLAKAIDTFLKAGEKEYRVCYALKLRP